MEYDPRSDEITIATSLFDDMYWLQQYYNAIMRSAMNHHFKAILEEKGYRVLMNEDEGKYKIDNKKLKEKAKENHDAVVERALNDKEETLTASEKKVKASVEKRAEILNIKTDNETFREELVNDKAFVSHLNVCTLLNTNHDESFVDKTYKEFKVQNCKSNTMKVKLINEIQDLLNTSAFWFDDVYDTINIPEDKQTVINKVFRMTDSKNGKATLIKMYKNVVPKMINSKQIMINGNRSYEHSVDKDIMKHHLDLFYKRNKSFCNIDADTLDAFDWEMPKVKKIVK